MASIVEDTSELSDTYHPDWDIGRTKGRKAYTKILNDALRNRTATQQYRQVAYDRLGAQQRSGEQALQDYGAQTYGFNNPSGMTTALIAQQRQRMPFGAANLAAKEAGRQSAMATGQAILNKQQQHANLYSTVIAPYLQNKDIENQAALGLAQLAAAGGGGASAGGSQTGAIIGAVGNVASAAILAGLI